MSQIFRCGNRKEITARKICLKKTEKKSLLAEFLADISAAAHGFVEKSDFALKLRIFSESRYHLKVH